jgi:hypothetical protein
VKVHERWNIWESGSLSVQENGGIPVDSLRVTIRDSQGRWPAMVQDYSMRQVPSTITWNRKFADGTLAPSGEYEVIAEARDIYGNEASDQGVIVIPLVATATMTSTSTMTPSSSPMPVRIAMPTQAVAATALQTVQPTSAPVVEPSGKPFVLWLVVGLMGLLVVLGSAAITDDRPGALERMKETFDQIMKSKGE